MLATCVCILLFYDGPGLAAANSVTLPSRRGAAPITILAPDGELLTVPGAPQTAVSPPSSPQISEPGVTKAVNAIAEASPPDDPIITLAPGVTEPWDEAGLKFIQTTYYSCVTIGTYSHCGLHEPILDASIGSGLRGGRRRAVWAAAAVVAVLVFVVGI